jgi:hypothetical protein
MSKPRATGEIAAEHVFSRARSVQPPAQCYFFFTFLSGTFHKYT